MHVFVLPNELITYTRTDLAGIIGCNDSPSVFVLYFSLFRSSQLLRRAWFISGSGDGSGWVGGRMNSSERTGTSGVTWEIMD